MELVHIRPGNPAEKREFESFNGRLRDECLNVRWFQKLDDARQKMASVANGLQRGASA